ncbi:MAG TPA: hypothetical protein VFA07_17660 [Chthonomonadaceae bacterium]|nr:hypothetical protein [Chthonomonadaceae bacterium]
MFGRTPQARNGPQPEEIPAHERARIQGGGLVQLIVTSLNPMTFYLFLNDQAVEQTDVESLSIDIEAPTPTEPNGLLRATLSRYGTDVTGTRSLQRTELFPCVLEIVALKRRINLCCSDPNSLQSTWVDLGLKPNGEAYQLGGLQTFRFLLTEGILDAKVTWEDGQTEDLLPQ